MKQNQLYLLGGAIVLMCICTAFGSLAAYFLLAQQAATPNPDLTAAIAPLPENPTPAPGVTPAVQATPVLAASPAVVTAGGSLEQANPIGPGHYSGDLGAKGAENWYKFDLPGGGILSLMFTAGEDISDSQSVTIFDPSREKLRWHNQIKPGEIVPFHWTANAASGGAYYMRVQHGTLDVDFDPMFNGAGSYSFELAISDQNDANSNGDIGDDFAQAAFIQLGDPISGQLGGSDKADWYKFEVSGGQIVDLVFTPGADVQETQSIFAYDANHGNPIWEAQHVFPSVREPGRWVLDTSQAGIYYLQITYGHLKNGTGSYTLELSSQSQNDINQGIDAGGEPVQGLDIGPGQPLSGEVGNFDKLDCYKFTPVSGQTINYTLNPEAEGGAVQLFDADQREIWEENPVAPSVTKSHQLNEVIGGPYYICVAGEGNYTLEIK